MADATGPVPAQTRTPASRSDMVFPQIARLELDDLLTQLIDRAQDVLDTQGRLRALLSATRAVSEDLSLPHVLTRIVESACRLIGAGYGAIGVLGSDGRLEQFIHTGLDPDTAVRIGQLPTGRGILGQLIDNPEPLRLDDLGTHPSSSGFPAEHPPMRSFLGVPIRVRDRIFGNIYLTEKSGGRPFTAEDEELLVALAGTAAIAVDHAQLYAEAQAREKALASAATLPALLAQHENNSFAPVAQIARMVVDADLAVVVALDAGARQRVVAADGTGAGTVRGIVVRASDPATVATELRAHGADVGASCHSAFTDESGRQALLMLVRDSAMGPFTRSDADSVNVFAQHASLSLAQLTASRNAQLVELLKQRDAIAQDMTDQVVSRLFAAGLALQGLAGRIGDDDVRARLWEQTEALDAVISTIRKSIFTTEPRDPDA